MFKFKQFILREETEGTITGYHGGANIPSKSLEPITFFSRKKEHAQNYLDIGKDEGKFEEGKLHKVALKLHNIANEDHVIDAAKAVGIHEPYINAGQYLDKQIYDTDANRVADYLHKRGFDAAEVNDITQTGGHMFKSLAVFHPHKSIVKELP